MAWARQASGSNHAWGSVGKFAVRCSSSAVRTWCKNACKNKVEPPFVPVPPLNVYKAPGAVVMGLSMVKRGCGGVCVWWKCVCRRAVSGKKVQSIRTMSRKSGMLTIETCSRKSGEVHRRSMGSMWV